MQQQPFLRRLWVRVTGVGALIVAVLTYPLVEKASTFWQSLTPDLLVTVKKEYPPNIFDAEFSIENKGTRTMCITKISVTPWIRTKVDNFLRPMEGQDKVLFVDRKLQDTKGCLDQGHGIDFGLPRQLKIFQFPQAPRVDWKIALICIRVFVKPKLFGFQLPDEQEVKSGFSADRDEKEGRNIDHWLRDSCDARYRLTEP